MMQGRISILFNFLKKSKCKNEKLYREVVEATRSSFDIKTTKKSMIDVIGKALNADRCFIMEYDKTNDRFKEHEEEYLSSPELKSYIGIDLNIHIPHFVEEFKKGKSLIFNQSEVKIGEQEVNLDDGTFEAEKLAIEEYKVYSAVVFPIFYAKEFLGNVVVHYVDKKHSVGEDELNLIEMVSGQLAIVIYQTGVYKKIQQQAEKESIARNLVNIIRSSLDINQVKSNIVNQIGQIFNADRCFLVKYDTKENALPVDKYSEYLPSSQENSLIGVDLESYDFKHWSKWFKEGRKEIVFNDLEKYLKDNGLEGSIIAEYSKKFNFKAGAGFPIFKDDKITTLFIINFARKKEFSPEEIEFIKSIMNQLEIALFQAELFEKEKNTSAKEITLRETIKIIRSTLDVEKIKKYFLEIACNYFGADRCLFDDYDKETNKFLPFNIEILTNDNVKSLIGVSVEDDFPEFAEKLKNKKRNIIIKDLKKTLSRKNLPNYKAVQTLHNSDAKSDYGFLVQYKDEIMGILILHYVQNKRVLTNDELDFLKVLIDQVGIAFYQAKLYEKAKDQTGREIVLRNIVETIRSSLDINVTTKAIVDEIGLTLNPNICFIVKHDIEKDFYYVDKYTEYRSSEDEESFVGHNSDELKFGWFVNKFRSNVIVTFTNVEEFIVENNLQNTLEEAFLREYNIKSAYLNNIYYADNILGYLIILYTKDYVVLDADNLELMKTLASQVGTAIYQSELYSKTKKQAERESLLRNITETIRSSLDIEETLNYICEETARVFQVERTAITMFPNDQNYEEYVLRKEYKKSHDIKGFKDVVNPTKIAAVWGKKLMESDKVYSFDKVSSDFPEYLRDEYEAIGIKAIMGTGIRKGETTWGTLVLAEYEQERTWNEEEKKLLQTIADQVYIAINQAELYEEQKLTAKKELLLRNIIETISGTLDINEIKKSIINEIIKVLHPDRVHIIEFNFNEKKYIPINSNSEYRSSNTFSSYVGLDISAMNEFKDIQNLHLSGKDMIYSDIEEYIKENNFEETSIASTLRNLGIKSLAAICIWDEDKFVGNIVIEYLNEAIKFSQDDIEFIKAIKNGTAIAFKQAKLYEKQKLAAERERISRNIIEILRSSIDKTIIKKLFVKNIGKFFNADRVFFSEYNPTEKMYAPVDKDSEYLSNSWEKSFIGYDWSNPDIKEHIHSLLEKREVKIPNWNEYAQNHPNMSEGLRKLYEDANVKSSYNFPVLYQDKIIGYFCLEFTQKVCELTEEDIGRIRSICTQAGIALYHADLYSKAQQCDFSTKSFKANIIEKISEPTHNILDISILLSNNDFERTVQIKYLNNIINSCDQLLELTKSI